MVPAAAILLLLLSALRRADATTATAWHGPTAKIWDDAACALLGSAKAATVAACEQACAGAANCTAINWNTQPAPGDRCQLRACRTHAAPGWSVASWVGYATWPVPVAPPPPPAPPAPPPMPLVLLHKQQQQTGAACLDGSPPGFYWEAGTGADADNWIVRPSPEPPPPPTHRP